MDMKLVNLTAVVYEAIETVSSFAESKGVKVELTAADAIEKVSGDPIRLQQVVWNLLTNSIKFSEAGSVVKVSLKLDKGMAQLQVTDKGAGIEPEFLPEIFKRFSQAEGSITRSHEGLGLGLAIVRSIVEMHGGTVNVESPGKNQGSTFSVRLPVVGATPEKSDSGDAKPQAAHTRGLVKAVQASKLAGRRILIVEDDLGTREALGELLSLTGASVRLAGSAAEGMQELLEFKPEELICDIAMPGEDGYTFIRKVRKLSAARGGNVPALALTALASEKDKQQAYAAGFQMHLSKPVDFSRLTDALIKLDERH